MVVPPAMTGEKMVRKESFWSDRLGQQVINPALSIHDNGVLEGGMSSGSRDAEGVPRQRQVLVENGRLATMLWSTRDAAQQVAEGRVDAAASTGSATSGSHQSPPSTGCTELFLTSAEAPRTTDELLAHMGDGYVVNSVMGAHTANPSSGDFSRTTSSILKVEGGRSLERSNRPDYQATWRKPSTEPLCWAMMSAARGRTPPVACTCPMSCSWTGCA